MKLHHRQHSAIRILTATLAFVLVALPPALAASPGENDATIRVMSISAHPDDEDGVALATFAKIHHAKAISVFFTRGEGGQNEIGTQLYDDLGALRTSETLEAASILGSEVYFLGFQDFGYSKTATETFAKWGGRDRVFERLVHLIRALKPDIIFTNHDTITVGPDRQHGNHQVAGIAAYEAFALAADPTFHPEQTSGLESNASNWQPHALFCRTALTDTLRPTLLLDPSARDEHGVTMLDYANRALACHRSQGMDKLALQPVPEEWRVHRWLLLRSDSVYRFDRTSMLDGLRPSAPPLSGRPRPAERIPPAPYSLECAPAVLAKLDGEQSAVRSVSVRLVRRVAGSGSHDLVAMRDGRTLLRKPYSPQGTVMDLPLDASTTSPVILSAVQAGGSQAVVSDTLPVRSIRCALPGNVRIGLVSTYDNTMSEVLGAFRIPYASLDSNDLAAGDLSRFTTIILDLRCFAYRPDAARHAARLMEFVRNGGHILCFYNKPGDWKPAYAPYPLAVTTDRVTEEDAPVTLLAPQHHFFTTPNLIRPEDWNGWIQERSVYLPAGEESKTSPNYLRLLAMNDSGERQPSTSLLTATAGEGDYTYTSLALYRQLRLFHEGALRLFFNLIAQPHGPWDTGD